MSRKVIKVRDILHKAAKCTKDFREMNARVDMLMIDAKDVDRKLADCSTYCEDKVLQFYEAQAADKGQLSILGENIELKETIEIYQKALQYIKAKWNEHAHYDVHDDVDKLREQYDKSLNILIENQAERIDNMMKVMKVAADMDERDNLEQQRMIRWYEKDNERLRCMLGISKVGDGKGFLSKGTQTEPVNAAVKSGSKINESNEEQNNNVEEYSSDESSDSSCDSVVSVIRVRRFQKVATKEDDKEELNKN